MLHYENLNLALKEYDEKYVINYDEHIAKYDGLPTRKKLELLTIEKNLPQNAHNQIAKSKQKNA